ncbi:T9SS type A sorting domain-containing protein [Pedobacter ureilyticus]|uniref:T9SS type A sorting domain-containing protein n=1 Tax=Pedobacter ureilyticus TaxID=1393051 RepID=A0ABW9J670_9SPHI|nr:T9SS type A sorting domain-containing protein [Pedobacter helvus]
MKKRYTKIILIAFLIFTCNWCYAQYNVTTLETGLQNAALTKDGNGNVYTTRAKTGGGYEIAKYTNGSGTATVIYSNIVGDGTDLPFGLAVASNGDVYFSSDFNGSNGKITRLNAASSYTATVVQSGRYFTGLAFDKQDRLYALEYNEVASKYAVVRYNSPSTANPSNTTTSGTTLYNNITSQTGVSYPTSISVATNGTVYFNNVFNTDGGTTFKGGIVKLTTSDGISYTKTDLNTSNYTSALFVDEFNNLYAIETPSGTPGTYKLYKYTNAVNPAAEFYSVPFNSAATYLPYGVVANANIVYAIDGDNGTDGGKLLKLTPVDVTAPSIPTGLTATAQGGSKIVLNWTANSAAEGISGYRIYGGTTANPTTLIASVPNGTLTYTHTGLTNGQPYFYKISAVDIYFNEGETTADRTATPAKPVIASATYNANTKVLMATGTNFLALTGANNDIVANKFTITAEGATTRILSATNVEISSPTSFSITLSATDQAALNTLINKNGLSSTGNTTYNLAAATGWAAGEEATVNTAQTTIPLTVSDVPVPTITSATLDGQTSIIVVTGTNFYKLSGSNNDIDATKFTFTGENGVNYTLQSTPNVEIASSTSFSLTLSNTDKYNLSSVLNKNGTSSVSNHTYNLAAADGWNAGASPSTADLAGNGITVSNYVDYVLPIQLVNFSHRISNNQVVLNWSTSAEVNNKEFKLFRSANGTDFTLLTTVNGVGNSTTLQNYSYTDKQPILGNSYYKLTQLDNDNIVKLERIIPVNYSFSGLEVVVYPNPVTETLSVQNSTSRYTKATLSDLSGKIIGSYNLTSDITPINVSKLANGVYMLNLTGNNTSTVKKIIKN